MLSRNMDYEYISNPLNSIQKFCLDAISNTQTNQQANRHTKILKIIKITVTAYSHSPKLFLLQI